MSKMRGWKRRKQMIDKWSRENESFHLNQLLELQHESAKMFSLPEVEEYPTWFKEYVLKNLVETQQKWEIKAQKEISGHYLLLLILDLQDILSSEVIIVIDESIEQYKNIYPVEFDQGKIPLWIKENENFENFTPFKKIYTLNEEDIIQLKKEELQIIEESESNELNTEKWYTIEEGTLLIWYKESI